MTAVGKLLEERKMTQKELAAALGLSQGVISRYVNGHEPTVGNKILLGKFFAVPPETFGVMPELPEVAHG